MTAADTEPKHLDYDEPVLRYHRLVATEVAAAAPPDGTVVDMGCGPGQTLGQLARLRPDLKLTGVDGDSTCLELARTRASKATLLEGDIQTLDGLRFDDVDIVYSSHALEHLAHPVDALHRWADLLNADGVLIVAVPNSHQPIFLAFSVFRLGRINEGHFYSWDRATFANFCRLAGFDTVAWIEDYVPLLPARWRTRLPLVARFEVFLLRLFPRFSNSHIAVLKRRSPVKSIGRS
jgi:SAM-dependent methyltransferase